MPRKPSRSKTPTLSRPKNTPADQALYDAVKNQIKHQVRSWPSAYASGLLVQTYKRAFQKKYGDKPPYKNTQDHRSALARWYKEEWINVCELPHLVPCGRPGKVKAYWKDFPYCRPQKRITSDTPKTASELSFSERKKRCQRKKSHPQTRIK